MSTDNAGMKATHQQVNDFQNAMHNNLNQIVERYEEKLSQLIERAEALQVHRSSLDFINDRKRSKSAYFEMFVSG